MNDFITCSKCKVKRRKGIEVCPICVLPKRISNNKYVKLTSDIRKEIIALHDKGLNQREIIKKLGISEYKTKLILVPIYKAQSTNLLNQVKYLYNKGLVVRRIAETLKLKVSRVNYIIKKANIDKK